jgi:hypothetical protein
MQNVLSQKRCKTNDKGVKCDALNKMPYASGGFSPDSQGLYPWS